MNKTTTEFRNTMLEFKAIFRFFLRLLSWYWRKIKHFMIRKYQLFWFKYLIKGDEFHPSLDLDPEKYFKYGEKYAIKLARKREIAHRLDLELNG